MVMPAGTKTQGVLALIVGSNPLPNYLAAATLKPDAVHLLYTRQTESVKSRLRHVLKRRLGIAHGSDFYVPDATDAATVAEASAGALRDATHLNYTGGTKVMAAQARLLFASRPISSASYVDEVRGCVRVDDGRDIVIDSSRLSLEVVLDLHGLDPMRPRSPSKDDPTTADALTLASRILRNPALAADLYKRIPDPSDRGMAIPTEASPLTLDDLELGLSFMRLPWAGWTQKNLKHWMKFLRGEWLEEWVAEKIREIDPHKVVATGVNTGVAGRGFECDILFVRGHRLFLLSCTTDDGVHRCKSKVFEAALRARQSGGDLARYCVASFLSSSGVVKVQGDVNSVWDSPVKPIVFGIDHLREWAGIGRAEPDLGSLRSWIDQ